MNLRKFISGVSALTIAASAFAGMAVTASAAADTYNIVFGTAVVEDGVTTGVNDQTDFTGVSNSGTLETDKTDCGYTISGSVLCGNRTASGTTYNFTSAATRGQVKFRTYITGQNYTTNKPEWDILGTVGGASKQVLYGIGNLPSSSSNIPLLSVYSGTENDTDTYNQRSEYVSAPRSQDRIYVYDVTVNLDTRIVSYSVKARRSSSATALNEYTGTFDLPDTVTNITGIHFARNGSSTGQDFWMDNMAFYNVIPHYDITTVNSETATVSTDVSEAAYGDTVTVTADANNGYVNPVISVKDANDNDVAVDANGQFTMPANNVTVTATASPAGSVSSVKVKYQLANGTEIQTDTLAITDCYSTADNAQSIVSAVEGDSVVIPFKAYILKDGTLYQTTANSSNPYYGDAVTLTSDTVLTKTVSEYSIAGTVVLFEDLDQTTGENAAIRASNMSAYNNTSYTSANDLPAGVYTFILRALNKGRGSSVKVGDTTVAGIDDITNKNAWGTKTVSDVTISTAAKLSLAKGGSNTIDCYDIIIAIKTADLPTHTNAEYDTTLTEVYNGTTGDDVWAKAYTFTVTPNDDTVTAVKVTDNNGKFVEKTGLSLTGTGAIVFGILAATKTESGLDGITFTPSITIAE